VKLSECRVDARRVDGNVFQTVGRETAKLCGPYVTILILYCLSIYSLMFSNCCGQRLEPTANEVMLGRMFLNEERQQLKDDMRLAAEDPGKSVQ